ncbi:restriction endonuclease [Streptococcus thermophilus TH1436]|jgi:type I restriction enzyme S subunit|uniref:restriction endonuclease subunit S n=1 Tax=Streptococcus TaxID=1301 RepID=UPI0003D403AB|nr:restriction endonuclease subunit S [Streptococcus thermophilus]ETE41670.1 restriction endonuclease [Streptococcus thermophilus TH1436]MBU5983712.1 restriction endonuclease subunit S [Streptococcus thermophilus]MBW7794411.1 restriction endonuclease subunit S [Streptococcus thermophilus]MBW7810906.1 restriction endonuclease subunit S [Streptococcus thermophilus]MCE2133738.1 restriction endonuclease subunit S [Streptococcus thermophilus]
MSECGVKEFKLRELLKIYNGTKYDHLNKGDIPLYGSGGLMSHVNEALYSGEAILLPRKGTLSNIMYVNESFWTVDTMYYAVVNDKLADAFYLYSYLSQLDLSNLDSGSTLPSMTKSAYESIVVKLPDLKIQKAVATILFNIRKKLEINNQINQELEAMAKTLYDYWFVQFDFPDQNGNPYKSSGGKMVYHPELKREIPEGWGVAKVEDIAQTGSGGTPKSTNVSYYSNGEIPWINSGELEQTVITSTSNFITEEGLNNSSAKLFPSGTILVAMYGATAGKVSFLTFEASTNQAICAIMLNDIRMRYYLKNVIEDLYQYLVKLSTGSARDNLSQDMIKNIKVVIPSNDILDRYYDFSNNIIKEITKKQQENEQLTQLRDWLLPMLMNGQVKV